MTQTTTGSGPDFSLLEKYLEKKAVLTLLPNLELYQFGREAIVPSNTGREIFAPYWQDGIATNAAPVRTETAAIGVSAMSALNVSGNLSEYAKAVGFSRMLWQTKSLPILEEATKQLMHSLARGWENRIQSIISDMGPLSANSWLAGDRTTVYNSVANGTFTRASVFSLAAAKLASNFNPGYAEFGGRYGAVIHPIVADQLRTNTSGAGGGAVRLTFEQQSMNMTNVFRNNAIGDLFGCRLFESPFSAKGINRSSDAGMSDGAGNGGYLNYVFAPEAFFVAPLANARPEIILHGFGSGGTSDPANRLSTLAVYGVFEAFTYSTGSVRAKRMIAICSGDSTATLG